MKQWRVSQLGTLEIYRIEAWTPPSVFRKGGWRPIPGGEGRVTLEFYRKSEALATKAQLEWEQDLKDARKRQEWAVIQAGETR